MAAESFNGVLEGESLAPGPFVLTRDDFKRISCILHEDAGIHLTDTKAMLVYSRLSKRLRALGLENFRDYCALVASERGVDERQKMIAAMTTNVTRFFREPHHFEHLTTHVVAKRAADVRKGGRLRVWSAACSDGQEPYSIAMTILSVIPEAAELDVRVLAPTKPMDPAQTVTQLATFSGVEQAVKTNTLLSAMLVNSGLSQAASLVGKTLTPADGSAPGTVQSVTLTDSGLVATLSDGRNIPITQGVSVS